MFNLLSEVPVSGEVSRHVRALMRYVIVTEELTSIMTHWCLYTIYMYWVNYTYSMITFTIVRVHVLAMLYCGSMCICYL
jgi:hypothetical protein